MVKCYTQNLEEFYDAQKHKENVYFSVRKFILFGIWVEVKVVKGIARKIDCYGFLFGPMESNPLHLRGKKMKEDVNRKNNYNFAFWTPHFPSFLEAIGNNCS